MSKRRFHLDRSVRRHEKSGSWTCSIGTALDKAKTKLRPKDWYFAKMTQAEATQRANKIAKDWQFLVKNWQHLYAPTLRVIGSPFAEMPHWQPSLANRPDPTPAQIDTASNQPPTEEDLARAYESVRMAGVYSLYEHQQKMCVAEGGIQQSTFDTNMKNLRLTVAEFPVDLKMADLMHGKIREVKSSMLEKLSRRTTKNRMTEFRRMLVWFYDSDYGQGHRRPTHFEEVFSVSNAVKADVRPYSPALLKTLLEQAVEREQLYIMLALNCGMYQSDIGRLTLDEINVDEGYAFWDREKQPNNPFKVRHNFWPETLVLARKYIQQAHRRSRFVDDYRHGKLERINCATLAFTDDAGNPLYRILPSGKCYDKIGKAMGRLNDRAKQQQPKATQFKFNHLRKSTNQLLREAVGHANAGDAKGLTAIEEMSQMYLAQRDGLLTRLYSQTREISSATTIYSAMNQFLGKAGVELRACGVFGK